MATGDWTTVSTEKLRELLDILTRRYDVITRERQHEIIEELQRRGEES